MLWSLLLTKNSRLTKNSILEFLVSNKLHNIYPTLTISSKYPKAHLTCQEQTLYNHLRIGHT